MEEKRLLYLYGGTASGKTTLLRLLDGHPSVAVTPIHDKFPETFAQSKLTDFPIERTAQQVNDERLLDLHRFQSALTLSRYNRLQGAHHGRPIRFAATSQDIRGRPMAEFDFYDFEEQWINRINERVDVEFHMILYEIFDALFTHWEQYPYDPCQCRYFVGLGAPNPESIAYTLEHWPAARVVFVRRDPRGCIASKAQKVEGSSAYNLMLQGRLYNAKAMNETAAELREQYPDRMMIVEFEDLILQSKSVINEVQTFLDITDDAILERATFCGESLDSYNENYIGDINDDWDNLLSLNEMQLASLQLGTPTLSNLRPRLLADYTKTEVRLRLQSLLGDIETRLKTSGLYP